MPNYRPWYDRLGVTSAPQIVVFNLGLQAQVIKQ